MLEKAPPPTEGMADGKAQCRSEQRVEIPDWGHKGERGGRDWVGLAGSTSEMMVAKPELVLAENPVVLTQNSVSCHSF